MAVTEIDVRGVLDAVQPAGRFRSVEELRDLAESLRDKGAPWCVKAVGSSRGGQPIHLLRIGAGSTKALVVGGPHAMEPIGSLTVSNLVALLDAAHPSLVGADVEWNIVPCIDPDGAALNEGWSLHDFSLDRYMRERFLQATSEQVDTSFPFSYGKLKFDHPSVEASVLRTVIDDVEPDFFFPLHNNCVGGAFFLSNEDVGAGRRDAIRLLLADNDYPLNLTPPYREIVGEFEPGFMPVLTLKAYLDYVASTAAAPAKSLARGGASWDYLLETRPSCSVFIAELGHIDHVDARSDELTGENLRSFKMRLDGEMKCVAARLLAAWEAVGTLLDPNDPIYRSVVGGMVFPGREQILAGGFPISRYPTSDVLFNPRYDKEMTRGERYEACMEDGGFLFLRTTYQFVRMLKQGSRHPSVSRAVEDLDRAYTEALRSVMRFISASGFRSFSPDTLARVQLGAGLHALNSRLA